MATNAVYIDLDQRIDPKLAALLDGKTFQIHVTTSDRLTLYLVELAGDGRCPVVIGGERCGRKAGHADKHTWLNGD